MAQTAKAVTCPECKRVQHLTILGRFRNHGPKDDPCPMSGLMIPGQLLPPKEPSCNDPSPETNKKSSDAKAPVTSATSTTGTDSPTPPATSTPSTTTSQPPTTQTIPGIDEYAEALAEFAGYERPDAMPCPRHDMTDCVCSGPPDYVIALAYERPAKPRRAVVQGMDPVDLQLTATLKEMFYQYTNRTGRSAQKTLGPSEIGTPCDRRLVMRLMGMRPVNPGGDNWASFVGTCVHVGLAEMFDWADAGQGRFATEMKLTFPGTLVPHGTLDLMDRTLFMVDDHKLMGEWSLNKLKTVGIPTTYRVQLHVYGMGARLRGERVDRVALIGWPRDKSSLDDLYVKSEPYDPAIAREALDRVDRLQAYATDPSRTSLQLAQDADIADDCRFCPYHQKDAKDLRHGGCNGRQ